MLKALPLLFLNLSLVFSTSVSAVPPEEKIIELTSAVVKVHVNDKDGNHGIGSGFVVIENHVVTSCHVIANARSARVAKGGRRFDPIGYKANWHQDLCILKFDDLPIKPLIMGDSTKLRYEQEVFVLGYPGNSPRPQPSLGFVKATYPFNGSSIIRTSAGFRLGTSGGPLLDDEGRVIGVTAFKTPGRYNNFYYSLPVEWIKQLLTEPDIPNMMQTELPFWDAPELKLPYFMQIIPPLKTKTWNEVENIAKSWSAVEPFSAEAWYYLGLAEHHLLKFEAATEHLQKAINLNESHTSAYLQLGLIAAEQGNQDEAQRISLILTGLDSEASEMLNKAVGP
jgi:tetratricopeptide (TPR) repeat protein